MFPTLLNGIRHDRLMSLCLSRLIFHWLTTVFSRTPPYIKNIIFVSSQTIILLPFSEKTFPDLAQHGSSGPQCSGWHARLVQDHSALHFHLLRHLKADMVCLTLVPAPWPFWLSLMKGRPNSITRLIKPTCSSPRS